jgi:LPS export ABC transporter permease LptF
MTTLDRYILREITVPFVVGLGLFFAVVSFAQVLKVSDSVTGLGITSGEILQALIYSLPPLLGLLIPVSGLFATLLGIGRLATDREIAGMCAGGVSPYALLRVPLAFGLVLAVLSGAAMSFGEPWGIHGLRQLMSRSAQRALAGGVRVGEFNEWVPGVTFLATGRDAGELTQVMFADRRDSRRPIVISARRGTIQEGSKAEDLVFFMRDGTILLGDRDSHASRVIHFATSLYRLDVGKLVGQKARNLSSVQEMDMAALWGEGRDPATPADRRALLTVTLHRKVAVPLATVIFALLAVPLAAGATGGARARGLLISTAIVGAYYYLGRAVELAARSGHFPAVFAAWLPNTLGVAALAILLVRLRRSAV